MWSFVCHVRTYLDQWSLIYQMHNTLEVLRGDIVYRIISQSHVWGGKYFFQIIGLDISYILKKIIWIPCVEHNNFVY